MKSKILQSCLVAAGILLTVNPLFVSANEKNPAVRQSQETIAKLEKTIKDAETKKDTKSGLVISNKSLLSKLLEEKSLKETEVENQTQATENLENEKEKLVKQVNSLKVESGKIFIKQTKRLEFLDKEGVVGKFSESDSVGDFLTAATDIVTNKDSKLEELSNEKEKLDQKIDELTKETSKVSDELEEENVKLANLQSDLNTIKKSEESKNKTIKETNESIDKLTKEIEENKKSIEDEKKKIEQEKNSEIVVPGKGFISSHFGWRDSPLGWGPEFHTGMDIAGSGPIVSMLPGKVTEAGWREGYGNVVFVDHGIVNGKHLSSVYAHLESINVSAGQELSKGQQVGIMGSTGYSTGVHLHWEIKEDGKHVDPYTYYQKVV